MCTVPLLLCCTRVYSRELGQRRRAALARAHLFYRALCGLCDSTGRQHLGAPVVDREPFPPRRQIRTDGKECLARAFPVAAGRAANCNRLALLLFLQVGLLALALCTSSAATDGAPLGYMALPTRCECATRFPLVQNVCALLQRRRDSLMPWDARTTTARTAEHGVTLLAADSAVRRTRPLRIRRSRGATATRRTNPARWVSSPNPQHRPLLRRPPYWFRRSQ